MSGCRRFFLAAGCLMLLSEIWKQYALYTRLYGRVFLWYLPFQLCSIPMYLCILLGIFWDRQQPRQALLCFLSTYTLLSGIMVFLDTSGMHYGYAPLTVHSFLWHFLLIGLGICAGIIQSREREIPKARPFLVATGIFLLCCGIAEALNLALDRYDVINMFYINPHYPMEQLVYREMLTVLPNGTVILIYIGTIILGAGIIDRIWYIGRKRAAQDGKREVDIS